MEYNQKQIHSNMVILSISSTVTSMCTTWDDNWTVFPAWRWPSSPQPPAAERQPRHGSPDSNGAEGYVWEPPGWCQSAAPGARLSLPQAFLTEPRWESQWSACNQAIQIYMTVLWHFMCLASLDSVIIGGLLKYSTLAVEKQINSFLMSYIQKSIKPTCYRAHL